MVDAQRRPVAIAGGFELLGAFVLAATVVYALSRFDLGSPTLRVGAGVAAFAVAWIGSSRVHPRLVDHLGRALPRERRRVLGLAVWTLVVLVAGTASWIALAAVPVSGALRLVLALAVAVATPAVALARAFRDADPGVVRRTLASSTSRRLGSAYQVLVRVPFVDVYRLGTIAFDPDAMTAIRVLATLTVPLWLVYAISPLDAVPDLVPPFTYVDDLLLYPILREIVYTGYDDEVGVRRATKRMVLHRMTLLVVGVLLVALLVAAVLAVGAASLIHG